MPAGHIRPSGNEAILVEAGAEERCALQAHYQVSGVSWAAQSGFVH